MRNLLVALRCACSGTPRYDEPTRLDGVEEYVVHRLHACVSVALANDAVAAYELCLILSTKGLEVCIGNHIKVLYRMEHEAIQPLPRISCGYWWRCKNHCRGM